MNEFHVIPLTAISESERNPRRVHDPQAHKELTDSVREVGVLEPILVRPNGKDGQFEIVAGARRYRAAKAAELVEIPAMVRELTDEQALELAIIENLQRSDVHPLDEANGYKSLKDEHGMDVPAIAAKVGKSESYVYRRLQLAHLTPKARKAFEADKINAGHAELIARLQPADQNEAVGWCVGRWRALSVAELASQIESEIHCDLHGAAFKKDDADLVPAAGTCTSCSKRSGFTPALFPDLAKKDVCLDRKCFKGKVAAHLARRRDELKAEGRNPVELSERWSSFGEKSKAITRDRWQQVKKDSCEHVRAGIFVNGAQIGKVVNVCVEPKCKTHRGGSLTGSARVDEKIRRKEAEQKAKAKARERAIRQAGALDLETLDGREVVKAMVSELWHEGCKALCKSRGWEPIKGQYNQLDYRAAANNGIDALPFEQLRGVTFEVMLRGAYYGGGIYGDTGRFRKALESVGVDLKAIEQEEIAAWREKEKARKERAKKKAKKAKASRKAKKKAA